MNVCFIQVSDTQWIEVGQVVSITCMANHDYYLLLDYGSGIQVSGEYAINVERLLRAAHFGKLTLEEE